MALLQSEIFFCRSLISSTYIVNFIIFIYTNSNILFTEQRILQINIYLMILSDLYLIIIVNEFM